MAKHRQEPGYQISKASGFTEKNLVLRCFKGLAAKAFSQLAEEGMGRDTRPSCSSHQEADNRIADLASTGPADTM